MSRSSMTTAPLDVPPRRTRWRLVSPKPLLAAALALAVLVSQVALAQGSHASFARILPETTIFALFAQPGTGSTEILEELADELDLEAAAETVRKLGVVLGSMADDAFDLGFDLTEPDGYDEMVGELTADCPALGDALADLEPEDLAGRAALGVSISGFAPLPALMAVVRTDDAELGNRLFEAVTDCYDSGVAMSEGSTPFYVLGDGSDFPVIVAQVDDTLLLASDPEVLRGMVRRAGGAAEPSLAGTRLGGLTRNLTGRGLAFTLNLAGAADVLAGFAPMLGGAPEQTRLIERVIASLRVINGVAASVTLDDAGLVFDSVVTVDVAAGEAAGEQELLDLLSCSGCADAAPSLIPSGAASLSRSSFSSAAMVAWLDSWLADIRPLLGDELPAELTAETFTVAGLMEQYLGADLGSLGLDWLGTTTHVAQMGVYDSDLASWLQGPGLIITTPVSSEEAAREGLRQWHDLLESASPLFAELMDDEGLGDDVLAGMTLESMLSFRTSIYRGVEYERLRSPYSGDYGIAVFGGNLVFAQPARAIEAAIDVHLGAPSVVDDPLFGRLVASQPAAPAGYQLIDLPRYLGGLATITDLAAGPLASTMFIATQASWAETLDGDGSSGAGGASAVGPVDVPTFDELIRLADLSTEALELLAERTGIAVGSSEIIDGAHWSTLRVPLR